MLIETEDKHQKKQKSKSGQSEQTDGQNKTLKLIKKEDNITSYILNYEEDIDYLVWSMQFYSFEDT